MEPATSGEAKHQAIAWSVIGLYALLLSPSLALPPNGRESWRETDVLIVGRNFCRENAPLWEPRVDARGSGPGITGMEFPILSFMQGRLGCGDATQVLTARAMTLLFAVTAAWALYRLAKESLGQSSALLAVIFFSFSPIVFYYGRSVMPDVPSIALALIGVWLLRCGLATTGRRFFVRVSASALAFALGAAIKLPSIVYGLPAVVSVFELRRPKRASQAIGWLLFGAIAVIPVFAWYWYARDLQDRAHLHLFTLTRSPSEIFADWGNPYFYRLVFIQHAFDNYAFPLATGAAILAAVRRRSRLPAWVQAFAIGALIYLLLAGDAAAWHPYYGIPAVPAIALLAAIEVESWIQRWAVLHRYLLGSVLLCAASYSVWRTWHWFPKLSLTQPYEAAKRAADAASEPAARATVFSGGNPRLFWFFDRKGWLDPVDPEVWLPLHRAEAPLVLIDKPGPDDIPHNAIISALRAQKCASIWDSPSVEVWNCEGKH
jgi:hypothetical protein